MAQKISQLEKEVRELRALFSALVPTDTEGVYKERFLREMEDTLKESAVGEYEGAGSLLKKLT